MMPGLASGNHDQSVSGNMAFSEPDTAGEKYQGHA